MDQEAVAPRGDTLSLAISRKPAGVSRPRDTVTPILSGWTLARWTLEVTPMVGTVTDIGGHTTKWNIMRITNYVEPYYELTLQPAGGTLDARDKFPRHRRISRIGQQSRERQPVIFSLGR